MNQLTDMDWGWWPVLSWRPSQDQNMGNLLLFKLALVFGSVVGVLLGSIVVIAAEALTWGEIALTLLSCLLVGWVLFCRLQGDLCLLLEPPRPAAARIPGRE